MSQLDALCAILWGMFFGLFFFGGLWLTVIGIRTPSPAVTARFTGSLIIRLLVLLLGLHWVANGHWLQSLLFLAGLLSMRTICMFVLGWHLSNARLSLAAACSEDSTTGRKDQ